MTTLQTGGQQIILPLTVVNLVLRILENVKELPLGVGIPELRECCELLQARIDQVSEPDEVPPAASLPEERRQERLVVASIAFQGLLIQGILGGAPRTPGGLTREIRREVAAVEAIMCADALLNALDGKE